MYERFLENKYLRALNWTNDFYYLANISFEEIGFPVAF